MWQAPSSELMALRLGRFFQVDPQWFVNMQSVYDLARAREDLGAALEAIEPWRLKTAP